MRGSLRRDMALEYDQETPEFDSRNSGESGKGNTSQSAHSLGRETVGQGGTNTAGLDAVAFGQRKKRGSSL